MKEIQEHLSQGDDSIIHRFHEELCATLDYAVPGGRPHSPHVPGRGALDWMDYGPLPITPQYAAQNVVDRVNGLKPDDHQKRKAAPILASTTQTKQGHAATIELPLGVSQTERGRLIRAVQAHADRVQKESHAAGTL